jgi:biotin carboxyl carrier protein
MPGVIVRLPVALSDQVAMGDVIAVLEAMKTEHAVTAPHAGIVTEMCVVEGPHIDTGTVIAVVTETDSTQPEGS